MDRKIIIVLLIISIAVLGGAIIYRQLHKKKNILATEKKDTFKEKKYNILIFLQKLFANTIFLNRIYRKVQRKVKILYPSDSFTVSRKTTELLAKGTGAAIICAFATLLLANGDVFFILMGFTVTYLIMSSVVNNQLNKINLQLLEEFQQAIDYIQAQYQSHKMLPRALRAAAEDLPPLISLHMQKIYDIITNSKMNEEVDAYVGNEPNRYMLLFLSICSSIQTYGDKKLKDGSWMFSRDLEYLRDGVDAEILSIEKTKSKFMTHEMVCIIPLLLIKPVDAFVLEYFEGTADYFNGIAGLVSMIAVFVTALLSHNLVVMLRDGNEEVDKENDIWSKIATIGFVTPVIERVIEKNYTRYARYDDMQKGIGNRTGPMALLAKQIVFGVGAFALVIVLFMSSNIQTRIMQSKDWITAFETASTPSEDYLDTMEKMGQEFYLEVRKQPDNVDVDSLKEEIQKKHTDVNDNSAEILAEEVLKRANKYHNAYFKFWYLLIAIGAGIFAFIMPVLVLKFKKKVSEMKKQEEVIMFQMLMMILMHTSGINLRSILEWMERFSYAFKDSIVECHISIYSGENRALERMKQREQFLPFRSFVDSLKAIDKVGVEKAFANVKANYAYNVKKRELYITDSIEKKSSISWFLCMTTLAVLGLLHLLIPVASYMMNMFSAFTSSVG